MNTTDVMVLVGLGSVFLIVVFGGAKTYKVMEIETPRADAQGCQQMFNTIIVAAVLLGLLALLTSILH